MKVYKFRCGRCGYESPGMRDKEECIKMKELHEKSCKEPTAWTGKREERPEPVTEIEYV